MKIKFKIFIICILCSNNIYSQNIYDNIGDFKVGTILKFQNCSIENFDVGNDGDNVIWDFSNLKPINNDIIVQLITEPDTIKEAKDYPQATLVEKYSNGKYVFLKSDKENTYMLGFIDKKLKIQINYPKPVIISKRPFSLNKKIIEKYTTSYQVNNLNFSGHGTVTIEADGFGTLILPDKSYSNVLRIKISQIQSDTLEQYNSKNEISIVTYMWADSKHSSALLKATETTSPYHQEKRVEYLLDEIHVSADR